jgi:hypothetical protein
MKLTSVHELLSEAGLALGGSVAWGEPIPEISSGIYIIALQDPSTIELNSLAEPLRKHWNEGQEIIYIGRSINLRRRMSQFYKHKHGDLRPHRGGQDLLLLSGNKTVFWSSAVQYGNAEHCLLTIFQRRVGQMPFANRVRSAKMTGPPPQSVETDI